MSSRRPVDTTSVDATALRQELQMLKEAHLAAENAAKNVDATDAAPLSPKSNDHSSTPLSFDQLSSTEQAAGSLGVHPGAWKPIKFMNNAHYDQLIKSNALGDNLTRRIEAFRSIAPA